MLCPWHPDMTLDECRPLHEAVGRDRQREEEFRAHEAKYLAKRQCPYGGGRLVTWGNVQIPEGTLSCGVCDCFGFHPSEVGHQALGNGNVRRHEDC